MGRLLYFLATWELADVGALGIMPLEGLFGIGHVLAALHFDFRQLTERPATIHNGSAETAGEFLGKLVSLGAAVYVDGLAGRVHDNFAVMADTEVLFHFHQKRGVDLSIEVVG